VTQTVTPAPTPVWARINAEEGNGAIIREEPNYEGAVIQALLNGTLVEVLPDQVVEVKGTNWVKVRTVDGKQGWIVRFLLRTATPAPGW
jgi:SH3-like domain-containing protein